MCLKDKDTQGRTPLMLAVCLGHLEAARILVQHGANVNTERDGWTVVQVRQSFLDIFISIKEKSAPPPTVGMFLRNFFPNLSKKYDQKGVVMFKFTCFQEATATGNSRLVHLVLEERDKLRY